MSKQRLRARLLVDVAPIVKGWSPNPVVGIGWDGSVWIATYKTSEEPRDPNGSWRTSRGVATDCLVARWLAGEWRQTVIQQNSLAFSFVQPLPSGFVLVGARCRWRDRGPEENAALYDWSGRSIQRFTAGDGIEDVRAAPDGTVWFSFFDEGVFGNYGWSGPGPAPLGSSGLLAMNPNGVRVFAYDSGSAGTDDICDACAMNLAGDDIWVYFYTQFPIVRIRDGQYRVDFRRSRRASIAVRNNQVLLFGDYGGSNRARVIALREKATVVAEAEIETDNGELLTGPLGAWGMADQLYLRTGNQILVVEDW